MERLPDESPQAFEAFKLYMEMGPGRTVRETCRRLAKSWPVISGWSARHHWLERAREFDNGLEKIIRAAEEEKLIQSAGKWATRMQETRECAYQIAIRLVEKAEAMLKFPLAEKVSKDGKTVIRPGRWTFADAARMLEVANRLKQLATGLPTERQELTGPDGQLLGAVTSQVLFYIPGNGRDETPEQ